MIVINSAPLAFRRSSLCEDKDPVFAGTMILRFLVTRLQDPFHLVSDIDRV